MKILYGLLLFSGLLACSCSELENGELGNIQDSNDIVPTIDEVNSQDEKELPFDETEEEMDDQTGVRLEAQADKFEDRLAIRYRVYNDSGQSIYLVNKVFRWDKTGFSVDPSITYTQIIDGELWLTKANLPVPENFDVEYPDVPYLTKVDPGTTFEEQFTLDLPLEPYHAYREVERSAAPASFDQVKLVIGWIPEDKVTARTTTRPDGLTLTAGQHSEIAQNQQIIITDLGVSVLAFIQMPSNK